MKKIYSVLSFVVLGATAFAQQNNSTTHVAMTPTVHCDTVIQTSTCAGGNIIVPFTVSGGNFTFGNTFTAQLSNAWGQWTAPVNIGNIFWFTSGIIPCTIPANTPFGFLYRIRIISSNPVDTSNDSPNTVIVTQIAQLNQIISNPGDSACPGDTIMLTALNFANSYAWSTGDTTISINVTTSAVYSVTTTDILGCQSTAYDTVVFTPAACTGIAENSLSEGLSVFPNPANDYVDVRLRVDQPVNADVRLMNTLGQTVFEQKMHFDSGETKSISLSSLKSGIYFLVMDADGQRATRKIIVRD